MDPLSIASGVAGLLTLAGSVISTGYTLASKIKNRDDTLKVLVQEIAIFSGILVGVQARVTASDTTFEKLVQGNGPSVQNVLDSCATTLNEAEMLFKSLGDLNSVQFLLRGNAVKEQVDSITSRVEHYKSFFTLYLQLQSGVQADEMEASLEVITAQLQSLRSGQERIQEDLDAKELARKRKKIIQWLGPATGSEQEEICRQRDADSGAWIFNRDEFATWIASDQSSYLWLSGSQGTGKTTIVSKIIETLENVTARIKESALLFHYCQFSNSTTLTSERVIGALVCQLLSLHPNTALPPSLQNLFDKSSGNKSYPTLKQITEIFVETCRGMSEVFVVIDGLDELKRRKGIIWFLQHLSDLCPKVKLKILISSRPEVDLGMAFEFYGSMSITASDNAVDIEQYVRRQVEEHLRLEDQDEEDKLIQELVQKADGMFLWVVCQLKQLSRIRTAISSDLIQGLPKGLDKTFESTLIQLEEDDKVLALDILRWLMFARRPLSLEELVEAIAVKPGTKTLAQLQRQKLRCASDVFEVCGSFIRQSGVTGKLSLAHYSIYEWLSSSKLATGLQNQFYLDSEHSSTLMTLTCAIYLSLDDYGTAEFTDLVGTTLAIQKDALDPQAVPSIFAQSPFLDYASSYWWAHIKHDQDQSQVPDPVLGALKAFFQLRQNFTSWVGIARYLYGDYKYPLGMAPIHAAALHGLRWLATSLLHDSPGYLYLSTSDGRLPLHIALENDGSKLIDLLLPYKTHLDLVDKRGRSPLQIAIYSGNAQVVRHLVHNGADVNTPFPEGGTALSVAIENGWEDLAELISSVEEISPLKSGRSLLHIASQTGSIAWASALMGPHPEMVESCDFNGWTPLHYAADNGHLNVMHLLLNAKCTVHPRDHNGWTPLHAAVRRRHARCIRKLIETEPVGRACDNPLPPPSRSMFPRSARRGEELNQKYGGHQHSSASGHNPTSLAADLLSVHRERMDPFRSHDRYGARSFTQAKVQHPRPLFDDSESDTIEDQSSGSVPDPLYIAVSDLYLEGVQILLGYIQHGHETVYDIRKSLKEALKTPDSCILEALLPKATDDEIERVLPFFADSGSPSAVNALRQRIPLTKANMVFMKIMQVKRLHWKNGYWKVAEFILETWPSNLKRHPQLFSIICREIESANTEEDRKHWQNIARLIYQQKPLEVTMGAPRLDKARPAVLSETGYPQTGPSVRNTTSLRGVTANNPVPFMLPAVKYVPSSEWLSPDDPGSLTAPSAEDEIVEG